MTSLHCDQCSALIPEKEFNQQALQECQGCGSLLRARVYPAYYRKSGPARAESVAEGDSSCFFHPHKQAVTPCEECGRFLCGLCKVELGNRNVCPGCVTTKNMPALQMSQRRYDSVALAVAVLPGIAIWPTLFTAPIAIYLSLRHWNDPRGLLPRSRARLILALLIAFTQIAAWVAIVIFLLANWRQIR